MAVADLSNAGSQMNTDNESLVWKVCTYDLTGGATLDVTGFAPEVIQAGHPVIADADGELYPMPVNAGQTAYAALPADHTYVGLVKANALTSKPMVGIGVGGQVNPAVCPYNFATIQAAVATALPLINFMED